MEQRKVENNKSRSSEGGNGVYELSGTEKQEYMCLTLD